MSYSEKHYQALDNLYEYMAGILETYKELVPMLKSELDAVMADDTQALDASMNAQQVVILRTKNFDEKMAEFSRDIEVPNKNLKELANNLPNDEGRRFADLHEEFKTTIEEVLFYRNKCRELLTSKLHQIGRVLDTAGNPQENTTYDSTAAEVQTSLFPKSFQTKI